MAKSRLIHQKLNKDKLIGSICLQCQSAEGNLDKSSINKLIALRRKIREIEEKGGIVVVESLDKTLITTYAVDSFRRN